MQSEAMRKVLFSLAVMLAGSAWAGTATCNSNTFSLTSLESAGCEQGDKIFTQWSAGYAGGTMTPESSISVGFGGTGTGPITDTFSSTAWTGSSTSTNQVAIDSYVQVDTVMDPGYVITGIGLSNIQGSYGSPCMAQLDNCAFEIFEEFWLNTATEGSGSSSNFGEVIYQEFGDGTDRYFICYNGTPSIACTGSTYETGSSTFTLDPSLNVTSISMSDFVQVQEPDSGDIDLNQFSNQFTEALGSVSSAPEPDSLFLLSTTLGALAFWRVRRRQASA